jgi:hypothetical protein
MYGARRGKLTSSTADPMLRAMGRRRAVVELTYRQRWSSQEDLRTKKSEDIPEDKAETQRYSSKHCAQHYQSGTKSSR